MKNKFIIASTYGFAALLYIIGPISIFKVCEVEENPMKCFWSIQSEIGIAILLFGIAAIYTFTKTNREKIQLSLLSIVSSIVTILIPSVLIGGCSMKTMPCQSSTFPAIYVIASIVILVSLFNIHYQSQGKLRSKK